MVEIFRAVIVAYWQAGEQCLPRPWFALDGGTAKASPQFWHLFTTAVRPLGRVIVAEVKVIHADSREALKALADNSIDSVVTDPPYALVSIVKRFGKPGSAPAKGDVYKRASAGFMNANWDTGETAFDPAFWAEVFRVLKPGAHVVAFGGTRTYHRLACAIEDAGFEIRDQIAWLYGSGFPKSHDVSKGIDKAAGAQRPLTGEVRRASIQRNGAGEAWDAGAFASHPEHTKRVAVTAPATKDARKWEGWGTALKPALEPIVLARKPLLGTVAANVLAHGTGALNVGGCRVDGEKRDPGFATLGPASRAGTWDADSCRLSERRNGDGLGRWPANVITDGSDEVVAAFPDTSSGFMAAGTARRGERAVFGQDAACGSPVRSDTPGDSGSAARFFYSAKADAEDRLGSKHPTVKPVDLMAYLCRLITPPGGTVLDPFAGSGTTGLAAMTEGFDCILIEREAKYVADIERRLAWARGEGRATVLEMARLDTPEAQQKAVGADLPLFGGEAA